MKIFLGSTISLTALFSFFLISLNSSAAPLEQWVRITTLKIDSKGNQGMYFVDKSSIETRGNRRSYWAGLIYTQPIKVKDKGRTLSVNKLVAFISINCRNKSDYQFYKVGVFAPNDKLLQTIDFKRGVLSLPAQGTKVTGNYVCSRK
ncbi:MAG TPA: surface-adhesin E family protein [Coleofasciculaceae cyanobacterium]|jgi:hypothetical protein